MSKCNKTNCEYINNWGNCILTACVDTNNTNFKKDVIIFPQTIGNRTFYPRKELEDYILMTQNEDYGRGIWC